MSTIPLSMREGHGQTLSGRDAPPIIAPADDDGALDELITHVTETVTSRGRASDPADEPLLDVATDESGDDSAGDSWRALKAKLDDPETAAERGRDTALDGALKTAVDRRAGQETESADFHGSRAWRDELKERYNGRIGIGDLLEAFADWHERLKVNPAAADAIAAAYLAQPQYTLPTANGGPRKPAPASDAALDQTTSGQTLNRVLAAAIDRHHGKGDGEPAAFAASARHRTALKEMFPGMTYAEACRRVVMLDGDLHRDPLATAARLAASYGMSGAPAQPAAVAGEREPPTGDALAGNALGRDGWMDGAQQIIAATASHLPDLEHTQDEVAAVLERPEFMHGPDMQQNLLRAHRVAQLMRQRRSHQHDTHAAPAAAARLDGLISQAMQGT